MTSKQTIAKIQSVKEFLHDKQLSIPYYQRPYKWQSQQVNHLLDDILSHQHQSGYRLGSVVIHHDNKKHDIVDGQQRTITLILILKAYQQKESDFKNESLVQQFQELINNLPNFTFNHPISLHNIHQNYQLIERTINKAEFDESVLDFILNNCEVVTIELDNISEAFQFFDSQNARGKDLSPHDLLKAFHLREFNVNESDLKAQTVSYWENSDSHALARLFAFYLFRIRGWINGQSSQNFGKSQIDLFKGVNIDKENAPYTQQLRIIHHTIDDYNAHVSRKFDQQLMAYPFQLDQTIINGRRFFEMIEYYQGFDFLFSNKNISKHLQLSENASLIMETIDSYNGKGRVGDSHTRNLFNCLLMYYYDKFAEVELSSAIEKIFIWTYSIRLQQYRVSFATIDNHVRKNNLFQQLRFSMRPSDFLHISLPIIGKVESTKTIGVEELFKKMGYVTELSEEYKNK